MKQSQAIIIGGSISGMLTARVLSEHFDSVTIIERDNLPDAPDMRNGTPQGHHLHALFARGQESMEELLPGITQDLNDTGAPSIHWGMNTLALGAAGQTPKFDAGIVTNLTSRPSLEYLIRKRIRLMSNIEWITQTQVDRLLHEDGRITGIETYHRQTKEKQIVHGDLIVDASGRNSNNVEWLQAIGYDAPEESYVNSFIGYATRWYARPENFEPDWESIAIQNNHAGGNYRMGAMFRVEGDRYVVTVVGMNKDYPPTDDDAAFLEFAKSLEAPHIYEFIKIAEPISPIYGYRNAPNRIRHFERMERFPENFIAIADAYATFNPIYGQGMSIAAVEALILRDLLKNVDGKQPAGFGRLFYKKINRAVQNSWMMATAEDLRYPLTEGSNVTLMIRIMQTYSSWLTDILSHDKVIAKAFMEMMNLKIDGIQLIHPRIFFRVIWHRFIHRKPKRPIEDWTLEPMREVARRLESEKEAVAI